MRGLNGMVEHIIRPGSDDRAGRVVALGNDALESSES